MLTLSTGWENGLAPGDLGCDGLKTPSGCALDAVVTRHGSNSLHITGSAAATYATKNLSASVITGSVYVNFDALPSGTASFLRALGSAQTFQVKLRANGKIQSTIGSTASASSTTTLSTSTWYLIDYRFDATGTTYTIDYRIGDSDGVLLYQAPQLSVASQPVGVHTEHRLGDNDGQSLSFRGDDWRFSTTAADYPIGPGAGDDTPASIPVSSESFIDDTALIHHGILTGFHGHGDTLPADPENPADFQAMETNLVAYRQGWLTHTFYVDCAFAPYNLAVERSLINGTLLGHRCDPIINPFGFGDSTLNWPAGGMADFTSGAMDSVLQAHCDVFNRDLPQNTPFLLRIFREMNGNATIYGQNGAARGGVNETPTSFINGWRYVVNYIRDQCLNARFIWCPAFGNVARPLADYTDWYPGAAYVDWIGCDGYVKNVAGIYHPIAEVFATWYGWAKDQSKPLIIPETQVNADDPDRIRHIQDYATAFKENFPGVDAIVFWDSAGDSNRVSDTPPGFLAAYQGVVNHDPFLGISQAQYTPLVWRGPEGSPNGALAASVGTFVLTTDQTVYLKTVGDDEEGWTRL